MTTLLVIQAHPHIPDSLSLTVGERFVDTYRQTHPADRVIIRDLYAETGVPPLNDVTMNAWRQQKLDLPLTPAEQARLERHTAWLDEFIAADKYVFINPMYNHFLPAEMKQYADLTAVAHRTFRYTANGPVGLVHDKKALHIQAAGGIYHAGGNWATLKFLVKRVLGIKSGNPNAPIMDLGDLYLTNMLKMYGVTDMMKLFIEGADEHRDQREAILTRALSQAEALATTF